MKLILRYMLILLLFVMLFSGASFDIEDADAEELAKVVIELNSLNLKESADNDGGLKIQMSSINDIGKYRFFNCQVSDNNIGELFSMYVKKEKTTVKNRIAFLYDFNEYKGLENDFCEESEHLKDEILFVRQLLNFNAHPLICFNFDKEIIFYGDNYFANICYDGMFYHCRCCIDGLGFKSSPQSVTANNIAKRIVNNGKKYESADTNDCNIFQFKCESEFELSVEFEKNGNCIFISACKKA